MTQILPYTVQEVIKISKLIFKRRRREQRNASGQIAVKINNEEYNKILEVADETGLSIKEATSRMVSFAYENIIYE